MEDEDIESDNEDFEVSYNKNWKKYILLFLIFIFVINESFIENVLPCSALNGRKITSWGIILQGTILVILYYLLSHLVDTNII